MVALYGNNCGIKCRACGATYAYSASGGETCDTCLKRYRYFLEGMTDKKFGRISKKITDSDDVFNAWLATQLINDLERFKKNGIAGRCEALKDQGVRFHERGYQCGHHATAIVSGFRVCTIHAKAKGPLRFVTEKISYYGILEDLLYKLACRDDDLYRTVYKAYHRAWSKTSCSDMRRI